MSDNELDKIALNAIKARHDACNTYGSELNAALAHKDRAWLIVKIEELKHTIYELQMSDPHLEFISRVQDVGLHEEWNAFCDKLAELEKE